MKSPLFALGVTSAVLFALPAAAQQGMQIKYRDLDLQTAEGQKELDIRIDKAAREMCGLARTRSETRVRARGAKRCYEQAKAQAKEQMATLVSESTLGG